MTVDGPRDRSLRVGDRERDAAGELLKQAHLEGRIDTEELQARLGRCLAARTYAELDALVADLPSQAAGAPRAVRTRPWPLPFPLLPIAVIAAIALGHGHFLWLAIPFFFFVVRPLHGRTGPRGRVTGDGALSIGGRSACGWRANQRP
jgi:hypothetical protein